MKDKIKQWLKDAEGIDNNAGDDYEWFVGVIYNCIQDLGLSNEWVSEIDKIEPDPDYGMPDYYQGFYDAIEAVEKLIPPSEAKS